MEIKNDIFSFTSGLIGGMVIIVLFLWLILNNNNDLIHYKIKIVNPAKIEKIENYSNKAKLIKELEEDGVLLTPAEYTNNVSSYYDAAITILATMLLIFSFLSYFQLRFLSRQQIRQEVVEQMTDSKKVREAIFGKGDEIYAYAETVDSLIGEVRGMATELERINEKIPTAELELNLGEDK